MVISSSFLLLKLSLDDPSESVQSAMRDYAQIVDDMRRFGKRAEYLREAERKFANAKMEFEKLSHRRWSAFRLFSEVLVGLPVSDRLKQLQGVDLELTKRVEQLAGDLDLSALMIDTIATSVASIDLPEVWLRRALSYTLKPKELEFVDAARQLNELLKLVLDADPASEAVKERIESLGKKLAEFESGVFDLADPFLEPQSSTTINGTVIKGAVGKALPFD